MTMTHLTKCMRLLANNFIKFSYLAWYRGNNMTVRDLYTYSNDEQTFILFMEGYTEPCFKGNLEDCPTELIDKLVYQFRAIDFNTIEVILIG